MQSFYPVRSNYRADTPIQLINRPVSALLTISEDAQKVLSGLGITTIFDLGASLLFGTAREIVEAANRMSDVSIGKISADYVDGSGRNLSPTELADSQLNILRTIGDKSAQDIDNALGIKTIRELASWPPYTSARLIINDAYGISTPIVDDIERPDDLIPVSRRYATERVQYDVIILDKILDTHNPQSGQATHPQTRGTIVDWDASKQIESPQQVDLRTVGGIDVSDIVTAALVAQPALGAVLTYRQSWFPQGLALGHLLHSMALAPGESTRIAMIDWSRKIRASTTEDTTQAEQLSADLSRTRAISEVTASVAREAQSGFSESQSNAVQTQFGVTTGRAGSGITLFEDGVVGVKTTSTGTALGVATSSGWASSKSATQGERSLNSSMMQNIADRTQQSANSVRNRRATVVTESSQQESEKLSTRVVTNYNHMHALTIQYFEVVQIYRVVLELARTTMCLFVPMRLVTFTESVIRRYRSVISSVGLTPEVRALALVQGDVLAVVMPKRTLPWSMNELSTLNQVLGKDVGLTNDRTVALPRTGVILYNLGSWEKPFTDVFQSIVVYTTNGSSFDIPLEDINPKGDNVTMNSWNPQYQAPLSKLDPRNIRSISLRKKKTDSDYTGSIEVRLAFDVMLANGKTATDSMDALGLLLAGRINVTPGAAETVAFTFAASFANTELLDHLEQNALYYSTAIWKSLDSATITTLLSSYSLDGNRLIETIDPVPVTVTGNYLVFRFYGQMNDKSVSDLLGRLSEDRTQTSEDLVPLPSGGVFAEAVLGRSNSAEKLDITRFWNWQDSPIPILPPEINPLTAGGKANDPNPQTGSLEGSVVNIVNPPSLPDPAGLAPLYNAISNGNMFRDMSGMAQTAALAQAALQAAQVGAGQATTAAGQAQQVAAQQLTDFLKLVAQVAIAAMSGGAGGAIGAAGGAIGGALAGAASKPGVTNTPTNAGALINQGRAMDERSSSTQPTNTSATSNGGDPASEWLPYPGTSSSSGDTGMYNEQKATDVALTGSGGGGGGFYSDIMKAVGNSISGGSPAAQQFISSKGIDDSRRWVDLITFRPPSNLISSLTSRNLTLQKIEDGYGDVNLDYYGLEITRNPIDSQSGSQMTAKQIFDYVRRSFPLILIEYPGMLGPSFTSYEQPDQTHWLSDTPLGSIMKFSIDARPYAETYPNFPASGLAVPEWGLVQCAEYVTAEDLGDFHWKFVTLKGPAPIGYHPVSGTREFGIRRTGKTLIFYVKAADRVTTVLEYGLSPLVFQGGEAYWNGFFKNLKSWVEEQNGESNLIPIYSHRHSWSLVKEYLKI